MCVLLPLPQCRHVCVLLPICLQARCHCPSAISLASRQSPSGRPAQIDFHFPQSGSYRSGFAQISHQSRAGSRPRGERGEKSGKQPVWAFTGHPVIRLLICKHYHILHHPLVPASTHTHSSAIASKHAASRQECRPNSGLQVECQNVQRDILVLVIF